MGWPEGKSGYFCVIGERTDGRYHALWEKQGGLWELGDSAVQAKDRFLVEQIWVDTRDTVATSYIRTLDGLCFYDESEQTGSALAAAKIPSGWTIFKNQTMTAVVSPVPDRVVNHLKSSVMKALVWVLTALEESKVNGQAPEIPEPWYKNLLRD